MYGDFFLYPPALLVSLGLSVTGAYKLFVVAVNAITIVLAFKLTQKATKSNFIGLVAATLWGFSPYRLEDVYLRGSVGEYLALLFIPCIVYGLYVILTATSQRIGTGWIWLSVGAAGVVVSHVLSIMLIAVAAFPIIAIGVLNRFWFPRILLLIKSFLVSLCLSAFFFIPFLDFARKANLAVFGISVDSLRSGAYESSIEPVQLFEIFKPMVGQSQNKSLGLVGEMPYSIGWAILLVMCIWCFYRLALNRHIRILEISIFCSAWMVIFFMAPGPFNFWKRDLGIPFNRIVGILSEMQFTWRLLGPASCLFIILGLVALFFIGRDGLAILPKGALYYIGTFVIALAVLEGGVALSSYSENALQVRDFSTSNELYRGSGIMSGEYLPLHTDQSQLFENDQPVSHGDVTIQRFTRNGTRLNLSVSSGSRGGRITVPLLNYPYYKAIGSTHDYKIINSDNNLISLHIPANTSDKIQISFQPPSYWSFAIIFSIISFFFTVLYVIVKKK